MSLLKSSICLIMCLIAFALLQFTEIQDKYVVISLFIFIIVLSIIDGIQSIINGEF